MSTVNSQSMIKEEQTILIVDDNATNIRVLTTLLEGQGFTTLIARNGTGALETANYAAPDLILLDVMMPGMDGFETCRRLKADVNTKDIPVIFMTALSHTENKVKGFQVGAVDYVVKPLQHDEVIARVSTHLRLQALTRSLQEQNEWLVQMTLQQNTIYQIGKQILSILDLDKLLPTIVNVVQTQFDYYFVGVWLKQPRSNNLTLEAAVCANKGQLPPKGMRLSSQDSSYLIADTYNRKRTSFIDDINNNNPYETLNLLPETQSIVALPLLVDETIFGVLDIHSNETHAFANRGKMTLGILANQIAIAIRNAKQYREEVRRKVDY